MIRLIKSALSLSSICLIASIKLSAQNDTTWSEKPSFHVSGFLDVFHSFDFNQPIDNQRQPYFFNHNRHNEFNVNLALVQLELKHQKYRSNIGLQAGTYAVDNYAHEPIMLRNIYEANVGISLNKKNNLWLDAGVFPSHLGFESAISSENMTLTRSFTAENSPYYLSGAKLTFTPNNKWLFSATITNGWQRIKRVAGNSLPSFGTQISYSPNENNTFNWSTFIGADDPDINRRMMYFNNFYWLFNPSEKLKFITGFDYGMRQTAPNSNGYYSWFVPTLIVHYSIDKKWQTALRSEYFHDENQVIVYTRTSNGFQTFGASWNIDYKPAKAIVCRLESRWMNSKDPVFDYQINAKSTSTFFVTASMAVRLGNN